MPSMTLINCYLFVGVREVELHVEALMEWKMKSD